MQYLGTIRHNTIAHKEQNTKYFRQVVKELDVKIIQVAWIITSIFFTTIRNYHVNMAESLDEDY